MVGICSAMGKKLSTFFVDNLVDSLGTQCELVEILFNHVQ